MIDRILQWRGDIEVEADISEAWDHCSWFLSNAFYLWLQSRHQIPYGYAKVVPSIY